MKTRHAFFASTALLLFSTFISQLPTVHAQPTAFTYQAVLEDNGQPANGVYDLEVRLFDMASGGTQQGVTIPFHDQNITNGLFTVALNLGSALWNGDDRWIEISVRPGASMGAFTPLMPRQPVTSAPYAIRSSEAAKAGLVDWSGLDNIPAGFADNVDDDTLYSAGTGLSLASTTFSFDAAFTDAKYWKLDGNAGTTVGTDFLGTTDNQALEIKVDGARALRIEPDSTSPNLMGGFSGNSVAGGIAGAVIGGGGQTGFENQVLADFATVGGGEANEASGVGSVVDGGQLNSASGLRATIGGGEQNQATASRATVGGGEKNQAMNQRATVAGGNLNKALGSASTVAGGDANTADGFAAAIGGGNFNQARGNYAAVPGGLNNYATNYAFAAGQRAKAVTEGSFVWADHSTSADFESTADNQFLIRAQFVGINRANRITGNEFFGIRAPVTNTFGGMYVETSGSGKPFYGYAQNSGLDAYHFVDGEDGDKWKLWVGAIRMTVTTLGRVGIGTQDPTHLLHVNGVARSTQSTWATSSDRRAKQNIAPLEGSLARVQQLRPVTFEYRPDYAAGREGYQGRFTGFVAQEVEPVFPEMVETVHEQVGGREIPDFRLLNAGGLTPHLVAAVKELNEKVEVGMQSAELGRQQTDQRIQELQAENAELKRSLNELGALVQAMNQELNGGER